MSRIVRAGAEVISKDPTEYDGVKLVILNPKIETVAVSSVSPASSFSAKIVSWNGDYNKENCKKAVNEILVPVLKTNVNIVVPHGNMNKPANKEFTIHFWSSPENTSEGAERVKASTKMWGFELPCKDPGENLCFPELESGFSIMQSPEGDYVACMDKHNLYIFSDLCHTGHSNEDKIFREILKTTVGLYTDAIKPVSPEELRKRKEAMNLANQKNYVKLCLERINADRKQLAQEIIEHTKKLEQNRTEMLGISAKLGKAQRSLNFLPEAGDEFVKQFSAEWDALLKVPKVIKVACNQTEMVVFTDTIYVQHSKTHNFHRIGKFKITISTNPTDGRIRFTNLEGRKSGGMGNMNAPHVFEDGHACFGNVDQTIRELMRKYEYAALVQILIVFLSQANVDDAAGRSLSSWPEVPKEEALAVPEQPKAEPVKVKVKKEKKDGTEKKVSTTAAA